VSAATALRAGAARGGSVGARRLRGGPIGGCRLRREGPTTGMIGAPVRRELTRRARTSASAAVNVCRGTVMSSSAGAGAAACTDIRVPAGNQFERTMRRLLPSMPCVIRKDWYASARVDLRPISTLTRPSARSSSVLRRSSQTT
jgi:hypothetical protein